MRQTLDTPLQDWRPVIQDNQIVTWLVTSPSESSKNMTIEKMYGVETLGRKDEFEAVEICTGGRTEREYGKSAKFLDEKQYVRAFSLLLNLDAAYVRHLHENATLRNVTIEWERTCEAYWLGSFQHSAGFLDNQIDIDIGDNLVLTKENSNVSWRAYGMVIKLPDENYNRLGVRIKGQNGVASLRKNGDASLRYKVSFTWKSTANNRQMLALRSVSEEVLPPMPRYIVDLLLGCEQSVKPLFNTRTQTAISAPNLPLLDQSQAEAVMYAIRNRFTMIKGPAGTGKTVTAATIVNNLIQQQRAEASGCVERSTGKILVVAHSNVAVDNLCIQILRAGVHRTVRLFPRRKDDCGSQRSELDLKAVPLLAEDIKLGDSSDKTWSDLVWRRKSRQLDEHEQKVYTSMKYIREVRVLEIADVICCTCVSAGDSRLETIPIDVVVVDEASQVSEPEGLIPLKKARRQVVLLGDNKQLGPVVQSPEAEMAGLGRTLLDRLDELYGNALHLQTQYRMHPALIEYPNKQFYEGRLQSGVEASDRQPNIEFPWLNPKAPMQFFHVLGHEKSMWNGLSYLNRDEAKVVADLVKRLLSSGVKAEEIGVMTSYAAQRDFLSEYLEADCQLSEFTSLIQVEKVEGFQGQEKDYIVLSCVRSTEGIGLEVGARRLNVALTRARRGLIIVGNADLLKRDPIWRELVECYQS